MKYLCSLVAIMTVAIASSAFAGDGAVPKSSLNALGLNGMQVLSDEAGLEVRGMSSNAKAMGLSLVTGLLIDPHTKSFVFGVDANLAKATAENAGLNAVSSAATAQQSAVGLQLNVVTDVSSFSGVLLGGAGGNAFAIGF
jgi:hypothetical protein